MICVDAARRGRAAIENVVWDFYGADGPSVSPADAVMSVVAVEIANLDKPLITLRRAKRVRAQPPYSVREINEATTCVRKHDWLV